MPSAISIRTLAAAVAAVGVFTVTAAVVSDAAAAATCAGAQRLQLRWSKSSGTALVSFSSMQCDPPPNCASREARATGTMFTRSPITLTIKDALGHTLSRVVDTSEASCVGRCQRSNRGGCLGGSDTHRLAGSVVRYMVNAQGQTTVVANKVRIPSTDAPNLVSPLTVTVTDGAGYTATAELRNCRLRESTTGTAITCSH
jgi:hypothetical protein